MVVGRPTLGIRFDIGKIGSGYYGHACWKVVWSTIDPEMIEGSNLFEGDTNATLSGRENVFCIAIQMDSGDQLEPIRQAFSDSARFRDVAAYPMFAEDDDVTREPLPDAGTISRSGSYSGAHNAAESALAAVRPDLKIAGQEQDSAAVDDSGHSSANSPVPSSDSPGELESPELRRYARDLVDNYKRAIQFLDTCGELTFDKCLQAEEIAGNGLGEARLRQMWNDAQNILPSENHPAGREFLRFESRRQMVIAIDVFESILGKQTIGAPTAETGGRPPTTRATDALASHGEDEQSVKPLATRSSWWQFWKR